MLKNLYVASFLFFGMLCFPGQVVACHEMAEKAKECCKHTTTQEIDDHKTCDRDCCKKDEPNQTSEQSRGCDGSCQGNCHQVVTNFYFALPSISDGITHNANFLFRKDNFHASETHPSSGFYFIWTPPNINS
jgi:hypothetical protein